MIKIKAEGVERAMDDLRFESTDRVEIATMQALNRLAGDGEGEIGFLAADRVRHGVDTVDPIDPISGCYVKKSNSISESA